MLGIPNVTIDLNLKGLPMSAASLSLLKGGAKGGAADDDANPKKGAVKPAEAAAAPQEADDEGTTIEVENLSSEELDSVVKEFGVETPPEWADWEAEAKRAWLKSQFDDNGAEEQAQRAEPAPEEKKGKKASKGKAPAAEPAAASAAEPGAKPKKAGKAVAKSPLKHGEIQAQGEDLLFDLVHEIETMKEADARGLVGKLAEETEVTFFKLGGVLSVIQANGWYAPYPSFRDYVEKEHGLHYRKATYWVSIYNALVEAKVPWEKVKDLGWTKLKEIAPVLTAGNVDEWVKIAGQSNTLSLIDTVKKSQASKGGVKAIEDQSSKTVTTKTFKVHEDQKETIEAALAKAKADSGTTVDTVALEYICGDFLAAQTLAQKMKAMGIEKALAAVEAAFPDANIEVTLGKDE